MELAIMIFATMALTGIMIVGCMIVDELRGINRYVKEVRELWSKSLISSLPKDREYGDE